ncbi:hypothetical protein TrST_g9800 [Triparma strigata]|uniref:Uncharacterized protein n=1 Tax=Triparma strigata TaxID=1606541 RepID=A0A9W7F1A5_9STRA|nr:hypothetical protein TrST_g9800 [Triparma strigata]
MDTAFGFIERGHKQSDLGNTIGAAHLYFSASKILAELSKKEPDQSRKSLLSDNACEYLNKAVALLQTETADEDVVKILDGLDFVVKRSYNDDSTVGNESGEEERTAIAGGLEASRRLFASSDVKDIYDIYDDSKVPQAAPAAAADPSNSNSSYDDLSARLSKLTQSKEEDKKDDIAARLNQLKGLPSAPPSETDVLNRMKQLGCDTAGYAGAGRTNDLDDVSNIINAVQDEIRLDSNTKTLNNVPIPKDDTTELLLSMVGEGGGAGGGVGVGVGIDVENDAPNDDILAGSTFGDIMSSLQNSNLISSEADVDGNPTGTATSGLPLNHEDKVNMKVAELQRTVFAMMVKEAEEGGGGVDADAILAKVKSARKELDEIEKIVKGRGVVRC